MTNPIATAVVEQADLNDYPISLDLSLYLPSLDNSFKACILKALREDNSPFFTLEEKQERFKMSKAVEETVEARFTVETFSYLLDSLVRFYPPAQGVPAAELLKKQFMESSATPYIAPHGFVAQNTF